MTKRAWRLIALGYGILTVAWIVTAIIVIAEVNRLNETQKAIKATQRAALRTQRGLVAASASLEGLAVRAVTMVCLQAFAPNEAARRDLFTELVETGTFPTPGRYSGTTCTRAVAYEKRQLAAVPTPPPQEGP